MVDLRFGEKFSRPLALKSSAASRGMAQMELLRQGSRLSVQPVRKAEFDAILKLAKSPRR